MNFVRPESLGSGHPERSDMNRRSLAHYEGKAFQFYLDAEAEAVAQVWRECPNVKLIVQKLLVMLDQIGAEKGHDVARADLEIKWHPEGVIVVTPQWSVLQDRPPVAFNEDETLARLIGAPKVRGAVQALIEQLLGFCRWSSIPIKGMDFSLRMISDGTIGMVPYYKGKALGPNAEVWDVVDREVTA